MLALPADRMLNVLWALLVDEPNGLVNRVEVRDSLHQVLNPVVLDEVDPDEWGMDEEEERRLMEWANTLPASSGPDLSN